jgi:S-adenosylmethionine decarboxylase
MIARRSEWGSTPLLAEMSTVGRHLLIEYRECDDAALGVCDAVRRTLLDAARHIGATIVAEAFHQFTPTGVSGVVVIAESHLSVHTWPMSRYAAADVYTCGTLDPRPCISFLGRKFGSADIRVAEVIRGLPSDVHRRAGAGRSGFTLIDDLACHLTETSVGG